MFKWQILLYNKFALVSKVIAVKIFCLVLERLSLSYILGNDWINFSLNNKNKYKYKRLLEKIIISSKILIESKMSNPNNSTNVES